MMKEPKSQFANKINIQVINDEQTHTITVSEVDADKTVGRRAFSHPDCYIWLKGRDNGIVGHSVILALQDRNMACSALIRLKRS